MRSVLLGVLSAVALLAAVGTRRAAHPAEPTVVVADDGGAFREVAIQFDPGAASAVLPVFRELLRELDRGVRVWALVARPDHFDALVAGLDALAAPGLDRLRPVTVGHEITTWSRDRYVLLRRGSGAVLMVPDRPHAGTPARRNDWWAPFALAEAAGPDVTTWRAPLVFDGGDLLATRTHVFATALLLGRNAGGDLGERGPLLRWLLRTTGRIPVLLGDTPEDVPPHHIGMFVTPLGGRTVLVGDPDAGLALLAPTAALPLPVDRSGATRRRFHRVAEDLIAAGFDVRRIPLVPLADGVTYVTFNNAVLERRDDGRLHAYVPQFGLPALDRAGRAAYAASGVVVHPVDVRSVYRHGGTVRCLLNVVRRGPVATPS